MKHGRRHRKLKEQAYHDRKDAEGYGRPYRPMPVPQRKGTAPAAAPDPPGLADVVGRKAGHALRHAGVEPDDR